VEYSIKRLIPVIAEEREKHRKRKEVLGEMREYQRQGAKILKKSKELLGEDDPVYDELKTAMAVSNNARLNIESFVKKGEIIEDF